MKKLIAIAALATAAITSPAYAGSLTGEVRLGDVRNGKADTTEYRVEAWNSLYGVKVGAEAQIRQGENSGPVKGLISAKAGLGVPSVAGFEGVGYVELGKALAQSNAGGNHEFWGLGLKLKRDLIGPVALTGGYRHREGFAAGDMNEERLHAGLSLTVNDKTALGATYYRTRGTIDSDAVGLGITRKF